MGVTKTSTETTPPEWYEDVCDGDKVITDLGVFSMDELAEMRKHVERADCWCSPTLHYADPTTGVAVYVHHEGN